MGKKGLGEFSGLDVLRALYSELTAQTRAYYKSLLRVTLRRGGSYEESVVYTDPNHTKLAAKGHKGAKNVETIRTFTEHTCGSLYAPVSALGYRQMDYEWALNFAIDCDLARAKTGDIADGAVHYIADVVADNHVITRRQVLNEMAARGRPPRKTNSRDLEERYANKAGISTAEREEILAWIDFNRSKLDDPDNDFKHDTFIDQILLNAYPLDERDAIEASPRRAPQKVE